MGRPPLTGPADGFRVAAHAGFPGVRIWAPDGSRAEAFQDYLDFWAALGWSPSRLRTEARRLAAAATWCQDLDRPWATMTLTDWGHYLVVAGAADAPRDLPRVRPVLETLFRFTAFWHWQDPRAWPTQPFPWRALARTRWLLHWLTTGRVWEDLPDPLPF